MSKMNVAQLVQDFRDCLGWPYRSPGSTEKDSSGGIDCSGMFVRAFKLQGFQIAHGSNTIWRNALKAKGYIKNESVLKVGMAVFKWKPSGAEPNRYRDDGEGDFSHIGLVVQINPVKIIHASTNGMIVREDEWNDKWKYWGWLKDVDDNGTEYENPPAVSGFIADQINSQADGLYINYEPAIETGDYIVTAQSGNTVNMRKAATKQAEIVRKVPIGSSVKVLEAVDGWAHVEYTVTQDGWMMQAFLRHQ